MLFITGAMERVQSQIVNKTGSKHGSILESASRRVRMIFSVMASPNRIDILRILYSKGPLTYSELKSLAGFKSKKESGKFAYHLRKLLRQSLVSLNKAERRYTITNLGKLVLSLARQIEERSIIESGKLYVRTTKPSIEEFDSNKIIQSLVREANMPLELAHKITEEVENKIYKLQTSYLTSSLIREMTNSILIEHGHDDYRNKLARLGLPPSDMVSLIHETSTRNMEIPDLVVKTSQSIFTEYLLNSSLPKDIVDMHLTGEINIGKSGFWNIIPDAMFININSIIDIFEDIKGRYLSVSRILRSNPLQTPESVISIIFSLLSREASREIVIEGFLDFLQKKSEIGIVGKDNIANIFFLTSTISSYGSFSPNITISLNLSKYDAPIVNSLLEGYEKYITITPIPTIALSIVYDDLTSLDPFIDKLLRLSKVGGIISFSKHKVRARYGLSKSEEMPNTSTVVMLQSLSINLPRIAYQSNKDETYFRARLAILLKPLLSIITQRFLSVSDLIQKGTIPIISQTTSNLKLGKIEAMVNLVGIQESVYEILGYTPENNGDNVIKKVIQTAIDIINEKNKENQENAEIRITMLKDDSAFRFKDLDIEKYGKSLTINNGENLIYSQGLIIDGEKIISNSIDLDPIIEYYSSLEGLLKGGVSIDLDITNISDIGDVKKILKSFAKLPFFYLAQSFSICNICGERFFISDLKICEKCESCKISSIST
ncbi:MAG TPA: anaerobic ribonucleoside-triphosphate reductase [Nitrososphaeraceae archaeon]|nr:anaerobic ribonucleoside-triphosphate reductase [Nitrososphaeraceae archaeon]